MIIDCISDLHGFFPKLDGGDLLIVAGDLTGRDDNYQYIEFLQWLNNQKYKNIVLIAGNHDGKIYDKKVIFDPKGRITYLCDSGTEFTYYIEGFPEEDEKFVPSGKRTLKIWGSPWTPTFCDWHFMKERGADIKKQWDLIPDDIDILITHGPPHGILDECYDYDSGKIKNAGCEELMHAVNRIRPKLHVFGHIHEGYGKLTQTYGQVPTIFVNASHVNEDYKPVNKPIRITR